MPQSPFDDDRSAKPAAGSSASGAGDAAEARLLPLLTLFASERGGPWSAYADLPELTWRDPVPQPVDVAEAKPREAAPGESPATSYLWIGSILLVGFGMVELPDDGVGAEAGIRTGNEGESGLLLIGTAERVEEITVVKFYPSADCVAVVQRQLAVPGAGRVEIVAYGVDAGADGNGAAYRLRLPGGADLYLQCFLEDEGNFGGPGSTTFRFTRTPPFAVGVQG